MKRKVLFADNDPYACDARKDGLERAGYQVYIADSVAKAMEILETHWIHLALLDIRLQDDTDDKDISGLTLAKEPKYRTVPKIILTRHPSYQYVREALGPALTGLPPAVHFIAKQEGLSAMVEAVDLAFEQHVQINWDLHIRYKEPNSFLHLASLVASQASNSRKLYLSKELKGLFRTLFHQDVQITLLRILMHQSNQALLLVAAHTALKTETHCLVHCGDKSQVMDDAYCYDTFAAVSAVGKPAKIRTVESIHFAATLYRLPDIELSHLSSFSHFYQLNDPQTVSAALDSLFNAALAPWYTSGRFQAQAEQIRTMYWHWLGVDPELSTHSSLQEIIDEMVSQALSAGIAQMKCSAQTLDLRIPNGEQVSLPNPLPYICQPETILDRPTPCGIAHGQINAQSVLVDSQNRAWLTTFSKSGQGPLLRDFLRLEMAIRLDLCNTLDLGLRYQMEVYLLNRLYAGEMGSAVPAELTPVQKEILSIERIRHWAEAIAHQEREAYLAGLLFCALGHLTQFQTTILYTQEELVAFVHSLLLVALICESENPRQSLQLPAQAKTLWIDPIHRHVWVEGNKVDLSANEYKALSLLFERRNQPCSHKALAEHIWDEAYAPERDTGRLNNLIYRLRGKIEREPKLPKYLKNEHGYGYQLEVPLVS